MNITADIQGLEPGALVELFELDATTLGGDVLRFHGYTQVGAIWWQGKEYSGWPIQAEGFSRTGNGQQPVPSLSVGNVDGSVTALCLHLADMVGAKVLRHRTLGQYLDSRNFPAGPNDGPTLTLDFGTQTYMVWDGNPSADSTEALPTELWYIEQKTSETNEVVTFELASALDFNGEQLPRRQIVANVCMWLSIGGYRGPNCGYTGSAYFDRNDAPVGDPTLDRCGGRLSSCKCRFGANNPLPFGSFPAADLLRS